MATQNVNLDTSQYVQITGAAGGYIVQSHGDTVRLVMSDVQPAVSNVAFHELGGQAGVESILHIPQTDNLLWVLAMSNMSKVTISDQGNIPVETKENGHICTDNSTTTPLLADAVFQGLWQDTLNFNFLIFGIKSDQDSATDGFMIEWSADGVTVHDDDVFSILADKGKVFTFSPARRYVRVSYTNGDTDQTTFDIQTIFKKNGSKASSHRIQDSIVAEDDAELVKNVNTGQDPDGTFRNVNVSKDGDLKISDNSSGLAIAQGNVTGTSFIHKFGYAQDFDTANGFVTVWDGAEDGEPYEKMVYTYSTTADIDTLSSDTVGNTQLTEIQGLDADYNLVVQIATLAGQTAVPLATPLIRVFRVKNINSVDYAGHVFVSVNGTLTNGIPTPANLRAVVHNENNQTEMAVFTIPAGKTGYMRDWYASTAGAKKDSSHTIRVIARPFGQVFQLKHTANIDVNGTSYIKHNYVEPEVFSAKTDVEIRVNTDQNEAGVAAGFDIVLVDN